jgi:hypothetical protein
LGNHGRRADILVIITGLVILAGAIIAAAPLLAGVS